MARSTTGKPLGTVATVVLGAFAGLALAGWTQSRVELAERAAYGWLPTAGLVAGAVVAYLFVCARMPWRPCPRCGGGQTDRDAEKNYRVKRTCWLCHGDRWPRPGTRLLRAFGFNPRT